MNRLSGSKLNRLLATIPTNVAVTSQWLTENGYSRQLVKRYCDSGWLKKLGQGAYAKVGDTVKYPGAVFALQQQLNLPVHIGGLSALELHGLAQYVVFVTSDNPLYLYNTTADKKKLPKWFVTLFQNVTYLQHNLFDEQPGLETKAINDINVVVSIPERAILEVLDLVPNAFSFEHANEVIENLRLLRPVVMQEMLMQCSSIKVKRLFLYLAEEYQLPVFKYLEVKKFDIGRGKRVIGNGGIYIPQYKLSVPKLNREDDDKEIGNV